MRITLYSRRSEFQFELKKFWEPHVFESISDTDISDLICVDESSIDVVEDFSNSSREKTIIFLRADTDFELKFPVFDVIRTSSSQIESDLRRESLLERLCLKKLHLMSQEIFDSRTRLVSPRLSSKSGVKVWVRTRAGEASGGDFVDCLDSEDGNAVWIILADGNHYGVTGQLIGTLAHLGTMLIKDSQVDVAKVHRSIIKGVMPLLDSQSILSLFVAKIDRAAGILQYLGSGFSRGFIHRSGTENSIEIMAAYQNAVTLRNMDREDIQVVETEFNFKDRLILVSDGVLEAASKPIEEIARDVLQISERAESGGNATVLGLMDRFSNSEFPPQDQTYVVIELKEAKLQIMANKG